MENHPIKNLMETTMENIKKMVDVNTIIGDSIESKDGTVIIPISKVTFGFASGGSEFNSKENKENLSKYPFGGGTGAGVTVKPVAFIVIKNEIVRLLTIEHDSHFDKAVDSFPQILEMIKGMVSRHKEEKCKEEKCCEDKE